MMEPIKCFEGDAKPFEPFWKWVNVSGSPSTAADASAQDIPTIEIDGVLSQYSWLDDEITPQMFKDELYKYGKGGPVLMKLNSPGGDVFAAAKMRDIMREYPGDITVRVSGIAASAAVMVAVSSAKVEITDSSYMMIHDPMAVVLMAALNIETLSRMQENLKSIKDGIIPAYAAKTDLSEGVISNMMTKETWMSAREAVDYGFADEVIQSGQKTLKKVSNVAYVNVLSSYGNVPQEVMSLTSEAAEPTVDVEREREVERLRERLINLRKGE